MALRDSVLASGIIGIQLHHWLELCWVPGEKGKLIYSAKTFVLFSFVLVRTRSIDIFFSPTIANSLFV